VIFAFIAISQAFLIFILFSDFVSVLSEKTV